MRLSATSPKLELQALKAAATGTRESHCFGTRALRIAATQVHRCDAISARELQASHLKELHSDTPRNSDAADSTAYATQNAARKNAVAATTLDAGRERAQRTAREPQHCCNAAAMGYKENVGRYSPKGIMLNLTHLVVFFTPIILCTRGFEEWAWLWKVNLGVFCAMFATPPWGWKKPHPYSDQRHLRSRGTHPGPW